MGALEHEQLMLAWVRATQIGPDQSRRVLAATGTDGSATTVRSMVWALTEAGAMVHHLVEHLQVWPTPEHAVHDQPVVFPDGASAALALHGVAFAARGAIEVVREVAVRLTVMPRADKTAEALVVLVGHLSVRCSGTLDEPADVPGPQASGGAS